MLDHLAELVVKPANESGGYGLLIGNRATPPSSSGRGRSRPTPRNWVAQPILQLSTAPTLCDGELEPRHVDLRPFILSGATATSPTGGLTRVALREGLARRQLLAGRRSARTPGSSRTRRCCCHGWPSALYWAARYLERAEGTARIVREHPTSSSTCR